MADEGTELAEWTPGLERKQYLQMIADATANPAVDVAKMAALMSMQERIMDREAKGAYVRAFNALQAELPSIGRRGEIKNNSGQVQSRYSRWEDIHRVIRPLLEKHGFSLTFRNGADTTRALTVTAILQHVEGHQEDSGPMPLPADTSGNKNGVQGIGSTMSYGKRYSTIALLNIVTEDDADGAPISGASAAGMEEGAYGVLKAEASIEADRGTDAYADWFKKQPKVSKLALVNSGDHDALKQRAADADARPATQKPGYKPPAFPGDE